MRVTEIVLKPKNRVLGEPDLWEQRVLLDFGKLVSIGERVETLKFFEMVEEPVGAAFRYMRRFQMMQPCLVCHGSYIALCEGIKAQFSAEYPKDKVVAYLIGAIRAGVLIKNGF